MTFSSASLDGAWPADLRDGGVPAFNIRTDEDRIPLERPHLLNHPVFGGDHVLLQLLALPPQFGLALGDRLVAPHHDGLVRLQEGDAARAVGQPPQSLLLSCRNE